MQPDAVLGGGGRGDGDDVLRRRPSGEGEDGFRDFGREERVQQAQDEVYLAFDGVDH